MAVSNLEQAQVAIETRNSRVSREFWHDPADVIEVPEYGILALPGNNGLIQPLGWHATRVQGDILVPATSITDRDEGSQTLSANAKGKVIAQGTTITSLGGISLDFESDRTLGLWKNPPIRMEDILDKRTGTSFIYRALDLMNHAGLIIYAGLRDTEKAIKKATQQYGDSLFAIRNIAPTKLSGTEPGDAWAMHIGLEPLHRIGDAQLPAAA